MRKFRTVRIMVAPSIAAVAVVVASTLLSPMPAIAAPGSTSTSTTAAVSDWRHHHGKSSLPPVSPTPQSIVRTSRDFVLTPRVALVTSKHTDPAAVAATKKALSAAGVHSFISESGHKRGNSARVTVYIGGSAAGNAASSKALKDLHVDGPAGLPAGGYVLATGKLRGGYAIVLDGVDAAGTFYAAQTLRQLIIDGHGRHGRSKFAGVTVRDWPAFDSRGTKEIFHGHGYVWSDTDEDRQIDFLAAHKMNAFQYMPTDDPRISGGKWRELYGPDRVAHITELQARASRQHVDLVYRINPEAPSKPSASICHSLDSDLQALVARYQQMYDLGLRTMIIGWDDVSGHFTCAADTAKFGSDVSPLAAAQAYVIAYLEEHFVKTNPGVTLITIPTDYQGNEQNTYRTRFSELIPDDVIFDWTGPKTDSPTITVADTKAAKVAFPGHPLLLFDNYPVNDYVPSRLLLGPLRGRDAGLANLTVGLRSNELIQEEASKIPTFTIADFLWNPKDYDPDKSWDLGLHEFAGNETAYRALTVFAENNYSSILTDTESPTLTKLLAEFWKAFDGGGNLESAGKALSSYFSQMASAPKVLGSHLHNPRFLQEVKPWLDKLADYGAAGKHAVKMLLDQRADADRGRGHGRWHGHWNEPWRGHGDAANSAWGERLAAQDAFAKANPIRWQQNIVPKVAVGVFTPFLKRALDENTAWLGLEPSDASANSTVGVYHGHNPANMLDGNLSTFYWSNGAFKAGDSVSVDLGRVRQIAGVHIVMGSTSIDPPYQPSAFIHDAVLEYSSDGETWTKAGSYREQNEITMTLPAGTEARYVRLRAASSQIYWIAVNEFDVQLQGGLVTSGEPAPTKETTLRAAADGNLNTEYEASRSPRRAEALVVRLPKARALDQVVVLAGADTEARVQIRSHGDWQTIGSVRGAYSELDAHRRSADAIRLLWRAGSTAPMVSEVIPWYADEPVADLSLPTDAQVQAGHTLSLNATIASTRADTVRGALVLAGPDSVDVQPSKRAVTLQRGATLSVPVKVAVPVGIAGSLQITATFTSDKGKTDAVTHLTVHPATTSNNVALASNGGVASASCVVQNGYPRGAALANDGDPDTRWGSCSKDAVWWQVKLASPATLGKVVINWERAYGKSYDIQVSSDGSRWTDAAQVTDSNGGVDTVFLDSMPTARYVRIACTERGTKWAYSIWEFEVYPAATD